MGGKSQTSSKTEQTTLPAHITKAQENLVGVGQEMTGPFLNTPGFRTAGFTPDQIAAFDLIRSGTMGAFTTPRPTAAGSFSPAGVTNAAAAKGTAAQVNPDEINALLNPYLQGALDPTLNNMRRERGKSMADIGARAAASGSFGGSREAIQKGQLERSYGEQVAKVTADLMAGGYDRATATALANAQMRQQTEMGNTQNQQQANITNASASNTIGMDNARRASDTARTESALMNEEQQRQMQMLQMLLGTGGAQQALAQKNLDVPIDMLKLLAGLVPMNQTDKTVQSQTETEGGGGIGQLLGMGLSMLSKSDARTKTNVELIGEDPRTGLPLYAYDDIWDLEQSKRNGTPMPPKRVSVMAQDMEAAFPGSTVEVGGVMLIKAGM